MPAHDHFPLGSVTWVPANSYNYIDIYAGNRVKESPDRVLESAKLLKQRKVILDTRKNKERKRRANHYDELCLQYQYAQEWLNKRNCQVSVKLTKAELKVFIKWFDSRMSRFQKADGIDVDKVRDDFVKNKVFDSQSDARAFLAKVDADGNGALSYDEFCEGVQNVHDYLTVMLLKKFIHSLKVKTPSHHTKSSKAHDKYGLTAKDTGQQRAKEAAAAAAKKAPGSSTGALGVGDFISSAAVIKTPLPGGAVMYTHMAAKRRAEPAAVQLAAPPGATSASAAAASGDPAATSIKKPFPLLKFNTMSSMGGPTNSIKKVSVFLEPGREALLFHGDSFFEHKQPPPQPVPAAPAPPLSSTTSASASASNKSREQDIELINTKMQSKLASFMLFRQMSLEEKANLDTSEVADFLSAPSGSVHEDSCSLVLADDVSGGPASPAPASSSPLVARRGKRGSTSTSTSSKPVVAWGEDSSGPGGAHRAAASPSSPSSKFKNKLVTAIARNNNLR